MAEEKVLTPMKAIRAKCLECCCGSYKEVTDCELKECALWRLRSGKRPKKAEGRPRLNSPL
ncbi:MAG: hypothetical protein KAR06_01655 [Deltaproteobacteria bacterium]|nr:hypothetical protein [Deltaproteobacteria bacterium]